MATHAFPTIGDVPLDTYTYGLPSRVVALFSDDELSFAPDPDEPGEERAVLSARASVLRDRLDLIGFTAQGAGEVVSETAASYDPSQFTHSDTAPTTLVPTSVSQWTQDLNRLIGLGEADPLFGLVEHGQERAALTDPLSWEDSRWIIRLATEAAPQLPIDIDITALVAQGYVDRDPSMCSRARAEARAAVTNDLPIIVLTEGQTDSELLGASLDLLYPHLRDFITFFDFDGGAKGGAKTLVNLVRSFVGASVANRIVAIFDNDAAGVAAAEELVREPLPSNLRVLTYPDLEAARSYPTTGPTGPCDMDVNGLACPLEMYFGADVLQTGPGSQREPVQWRGPVAARYQGQLGNKAELQRRFRAKLEEGDRELGDWTGIQSILDALRRAFH